MKSNKLSFQIFLGHTFLLTVLLSLGKSCLSSISSRKICFRTVFGHMLRLLARRTYNRWGRSWKITNYNTVTWISHGVLYCYRSTPIEYLSAKQDSSAAIRGNVEKELKLTLLQWQLRNLVVSSMKYFLSTFVFL